MTETAFVAQNSFDVGFSVFCELPTDVARGLLPPHLEPLELRHGSAVLSTAIFDFTSGPAGPYRELVQALHVVPILETGRPMPRAAVYPFQLGSTTLSACEYAVDVWHFPHWRERLEIEIAESDDAVTARVSEGGGLVLEATATKWAWAPGSQTYQSFMHDEASYLAYVTHAGELSEHEEERGSLRLFEHPFHGELEISTVEGIPFRETWIKAGIQGFEPAVRL